MNQLQLFGENILFGGHFNGGRCRCGFVSRSCNLDLRWRSLREHESIIHISSIAACYNQIRNTRFHANEFPVTFSFSLRVIVLVTNCNQTQSFPSSSGSDTRLSFPKSALEKAGISETWSHKGSCHIAKWLFKSIVLDPFPSFVSLQKKLVYLTLTVNVCRQC